MTGPNEIAEVFGIFHDGDIAGGTTAEDAAEVVVEIEYLGERVRPDYRRFTIRFSGFTGVRFAPWTDEGAPSIADITDLAEIVRLDLGILSADTEDGAVRVACTQDRPESLVPITSSQTNRTYTLTHKGVDCQVGGVSGTYKRGVRLLVGGSGGGELDLLLLHFNGKWLEAAV